jgi:hypothetical protein
MIVVAAGFALFVAAVLLVTVEFLSGLIPVNLIPSTLRRTSPVLDAGIGLWLALAAAVASIGAVLISTLTWIDRRAWMRSENRGKLVATALLVGMSALVAWLRYEPWLASSILGHAFDLPGRAEPWIGPGSLLPLLLLGVSVLLALFLRTVAAGLVAAASGWLITFLAAMTVITADVLAEIRIGDLVGNSPSDATELTAHATFALWATFGVGIGVAMLGAYLVSWRPRFGGE